MFTLNDTVLGRLNLNPIAEAGGGPVKAATLELDHGQRGEIGANTLAAWPPLSDRLDAQEWSTGRIMWNGSYSCMPYMVVLPDGSIVSTLTVGDSDVEGDAGQRTIILKSVDHGATWVTTAAMEPVGAPSSSWGMPWLDAATGRLYVFYTYNVDNITVVPNNDGSGSGAGREDSVGVVAYRSSVDGGTTWSQRRHLDLPATAIDLRNPWGGAHRLLWLSGHPVQHGGSVYFGLSKMGVVADNYMWGDTEAFVVKATETSSPGVLTGSISAPIRTPEPVNEESSPVVFADGLIAVTFRTDTGSLGEATSSDDGATWDVRYARDDAGAVVPQPRGKAPQFMLPDGRVFMWGYNNNVVPVDAFGGPRHPVYYRLGVRNDDRIVWGAPRLLLWDKTMTAQMSYPGVVVDGDALLVAVTEKVTARVFRFPLTGL